MITIVNETKHIIIMEAALPFIKITLDLGASNDIRSLNIQTVACIQTNYNH